MRAAVPKLLEQHRLKTGQFGTEAAHGFNGYFELQGPCGERLRIVASTAKLPQAEGWEHVSVSTKRRIPNWTEMCFVKDLFWDEEECVVQYHPPRSDYVNNHPHTLHLWRHIDQPFPRPPSIMVGVKDHGLIKTRAEGLRLKAKVDQEMFGAKGMDLEALRKLPKIRARSERGES